MKLFQVVSVAVLSAPALANAVELPDDIAARGEIVVLQAHAEGAQVYECKVDASNKLIWQFREPIATLIVDGKTAGRHYAGPTWEIAGSAIGGKMVAHAPSGGSNDIPWLKLDVTDRKGEGPLNDVTTVQRINTVGGSVQGGCEKVGDFRLAPYSADYVFLKK